MQIVEEISAVIIARSSGPETCSAQEQRRAGRGFVRGTVGDPWWSPTLTTMGPRVLSESLGRNFNNFNDHNWKITTLYFILVIQLMKYSF